MPAESGERGINVNSYKDYRKYTVIHTGGRDTTGQQREREREKRGEGERERQTEGERENEKTASLGSARQC